MANFKVCDLAEAIGEQGPRVLSTVEKFQFLELTFRSTCKGFLLCMVNLYTAVELRYPYCHVLSFMLLGVSQHKD